MILADNPISPALIRGDLALVLVGVVEAAEPL